MDGSTTPGVLLCFVGERGKKRQVAWVSCGNGERPDSSCLVLGLAKLQARRVDAYGRELHKIRWRRRGTWMCSPLSPALCFLRMMGNGHG